MKRKHAREKIMIEVYKRNDPIYSVFIDGEAQYVDDRKMLFGENVYVGIYYHYRIIGGGTRKEYYLIKGVPGKAVKTDYKLPGVEGNYRIVGDITGPKAVRIEKVYIYLHKQYNINEIKEEVMHRIINTIKKVNIYKPEIVNTMLDLIIKAYN